MRTRKTFVFIVHGARAEHPSLRNLVRWVRERGHRVQPRITWEAGDASAFAAEAAAAGADAVVALGGDGTVNEVVNGLDGTTTALGVIPIGTANDFARQVGIPMDVDHAMDVILRRKARPIDTGELNGRRFLNVSTGGVGAEATAETPADAKESLGILAYAITGVRKLKDLEPRTARFSGPGFDRTLEFLLFAVGNGQMTGGGTAITPRASMTDGLLDLCIVEAMPVADFTRMAFRVKKGEHLDDARVHYAQLAAITIRSRQPLTVNLDGETSTASRLSYRARPLDLLVHLPHPPGGVDRE